MKSIYKHESLSINLLMKMSPATPANTTDRQVPDSNTKYSVAGIGNFYSSRKGFDEPLKASDELSSVK